MNNAFSHFEALIEQTNIAHGLYRYLADQKVPIDATDLLRWEWVLSISAMDKYIHDVVRIGIIKEFRGERPKTTKYNDFRVSLGWLDSTDNLLNAEIMLENEIIRQHGYIAFQSPKKIADALSYIWQENDKWGAISQNMPIYYTGHNIKIMLNNIIFRRNKIVHEGDSVDATLPFCKQTIEEKDVEDVVSFVKDLVKAMHMCITI